MHLAKHSREERILEMTMNRPKSRRSSISTNSTMNSSISSIASLRSQLDRDAIRREIDRRRYLCDPVAWQEERLGQFLYSKQRVICESVLNHRRTAVRSCHNSGKSWI